MGLILVFGGNRYVILDRDRCIRGFNKARNKCASWFDLMIGEIRHFE